MNYFKSLAGIKSTVLATLLCGACLGFTACSDNNPVNPDKKMSLTVNGEHYDIALPVHAPVNLITLNTTRLTDLEQSGETIHACQMVVNQEYNIILTHKIEQAAVGSVNLVKGLTRLTGLTAAAVCSSARPSM